MCSSSASLRAGWPSSPRASRRRRTGRRTCSSSSARPTASRTPRYPLDDEEARHLAAYLKTLAAAPSPGVTRSEIHFATVVAAGVEPEKRRAMLEVVNAYFRWRNADTRHLQQRSGLAGPYQKDFFAASREWVLHVWELKGARTVLIIRPRSLRVVH